MWCTSVTRGFFSHSGVRNVIPLTTSRTTSASRASPRRTAHAARGKTVVREPMWCSSSPGAGRETGFGARVRARDDRDAMSPLEPMGDLAEQVRARAAALRVRPIAVGQEQDVPHCRHDRSRLRPLHWPAYAVRCATPARARRRCGGPRHRPPPRRSRRAPATTSTPTRSARRRSRRRPPRRRALRPRPRRRRPPRRRRAPEPAAPPGARGDAGARGPAAAVHRLRRLADRRRRGTPARCRPHAPRAPS